MANFNQVYQSAEALGDVSSLSDFGNFQSRVRNRIIGKAAGRAMGSLNVFGLIAWAEFFNFITNQVRKEAAEPRVVGTYASYAAGYEFGFSNASGMRRQRPFFREAVQDSLAEMFGGQGPKEPIRLARSGLYTGGEFGLDMRSLIRGDVGGRIARRSAGRETTRFFWGALMNPDKNIMESLAKLIVRKARKNVEEQNLVDTGALKNSITWGEDWSDLKSKSYKAIRGAASGDPRIDRRFGEF